MTELKSKIIQALSHGDIKMIPKWRLALYSFGLLAALSFLFLVAIFILSLVFFTLSRYGFMYVPLFGFMMIMHTLKAVPLFLLLCTIILLVVIEVLSRRYAFSFRRPLALTLLAITSVAVVLSFLVSLTSVHEYVHEYARGHNLAAVANVYSRPLPPRGGEMTVLRGTVITSSSSFVIVELFDGTSVNAYASTSLSTTTFPGQGEDVLLFGSFVGDDFQIVGSRNAPQMPFEHERMMKRSGEMRKMMLTPQDEINIFRGR